MFPARHPSPPRCASRRAFALPLVVLLVLAAGLTVAILMERHGTSYRAVARQVGNYKNHHRSAGIRECILRWLDTSRGRLEQSIDTDGHAFTMIVPGRGEIRVYFQDAQGALLTDTSQVIGLKREILDDARFLLSQIQEENLPEGVFRPAGPPEISVSSAPAIVIQALCIAITGEERSGIVAANAILARRSAGRAEAGTIQNFLADVQLSEEQERDLASLLVVQPKLYEVLAETVDSSGKLLDRSAGLYLVDEARNDTFKQGGFLTWDELPLQ